MPQKALSAVIGAYLTLSVGVSAFVFHTFGAAPTVGMLVILLIPFSVIVRMRLAGRPMRSQEAAYLGILLLCTIIAVGGTIRMWKNRGMDRYHAEDLRYAAFAEVLQGEPRFSNVTLSVEGYHVLYARGTVASQADFDSVTLLARKYKVRFNNKLRIESMHSDRSDARGD